METAMRHPARRAASVRDDNETMLDLNAPEPPHRQSAHGRRATA